MVWDNDWCECFGELLPPEWLKDWGWDQQQQYIFEAEMMPYAASLMMWKRFLKGKCLFVQRSGVISGSFIAGIRSGVLSSECVEAAHASINEIRSHSLKVTALSWIAKAGFVGVWATTLTLGLGVRRSMREMRYGTAAERAVQSDPPHCRRRVFA